MAVLKKLGLPTVWHGDIERALDFTAHDKKRNGDKIDVILVNEIGEYSVERMKEDDFKSLVRSANINGEDRV